MIKDALLFASSEYPLPVPRMATSQGESQRPSLPAFDISMMVIATVAVALRFWSRLIHRSQYNSRLWWDDWVILMALVCLQRATQGPGVG